MEPGINLRAIQKEMGHECCKTASVYTQLLEVTQHDTERRINGWCRGCASCGESDMELSTLSLSDIGRALVPPRDRAVVGLQRHHRCRAVLSDDLHAALRASRGLA